MTHKKESAGGCDATTADTNNAPTIVPFSTRITSAFMHLAATLATIFRGLA